MRSERKQQLSTEPGPVFAYMYLEYRGTRPSRQGGTRACPDRDSFLHQRGNGVHNLIKGIYVCPGSVLNYHTVRSDASCAWSTRGCSRGGMAGENKCGAAWHPWSRVGPESESGRRISQLGPKRNVCVE